MPLLGGFPLEELRKWSGREIKPFQGAAMISTYEGIYVMADRIPAEGERG